MPSAIGIVRSSTDPAVTVTVRLTRMKFTAEMYSSWLPPVTSLISNRPSSPVSVVCPVSCRRTETFCRPVPSRASTTMP